MSTGVKKYERKVHFVRLFKVLSKIQDEARRMAVATQTQVAFFQGKIKDLLDQAGVYSDVHHQYQAYAQALDKSQKELAFMVDLIRQHQILRDRFERRGLDPEILDAIDRLVIYRTTNY